MPERAAWAAGQMPARSPQGGTYPALALWLRWTVAVAVGELIGFGVPALVGALAGAAGIVDTVAGRVLLILAGAGEGAVLALAEWLVLRRLLPDLPVRAWVAATAGAAALAWALGLLPTSLGGFSITPLAIAAAAVLGVIFLLTIGGSQWLVLRHHVRRSGWWIAANAIAWPAGVAVPVLALTTIPDDSSTPVMIAVAVLSGLLMGAVVGAITGVALVRLIPPRRAPG